MPSAIMAPGQVRIIRATGNGKLGPGPKQDATAKPAVAEQRKSLSSQFLPHLGEAERGVLLAQLLQELLGVSTKEADRKGAAADLAAYVKTYSIRSPTASGVLEKLRAAADDSAVPAGREGAFLAYAALCKNVGAACEPYLVPVLPLMLERMADKVAAVRVAAEGAGLALAGCLCPHAVRLVMPVLFSGMEGRRAWQTKAGALALLQALVRGAPQQVAACLPDIVPAVSECMYDAKDQVKAAAVSAMTVACKAVGNKDVEPFVPAVVSCMARPAEVPDCIHKLGALTFVQQVEAPVLAVMVPLLVRGLREKATIVRKTAIIIDNMRKLVYNPAEAAVFLPRLLPGLEKAAAEVPNPETRSVVAAAAAALLEHGAKAGQAAVAAPAHHDVTDQVVHTRLTEALPESSAQQVDATVLDYICSLAHELIKAETFFIEEWERCVCPYLAPYMSEADSKAAARAFLDKCDADSMDQATTSDDDEEGEDLCNCEFSLAYGGKILLDKAVLRLKRGRRYGLCGANGVGKSTLMRAIANGQLDGFPPRDVLKTVYVEHDIDSSVAEASVVDFVCHDPAFADIARSEVELVLASVGFDNAMQQSAIASLSGGWKMKLALARAMLMKADIMLLDEPTNHLDVKNVAWLEGYLVGLTQVTCMIVSHDSGFLDTVCTDILHYNSRKLRRYKGNLSEFVKKVPEAKSYYELQSASLTFTLPKPGYLDGVKRRDQIVLRMTGVAFAYPGTTRQVLRNVTVRCSMNSRVAVLGANGAGKSTMIKLLTGEMQPVEGTVWKHPNMRIAYVAQHAFHHLEQHLDWSALEYIRWRYEIGEDREGLDKVDRQLTEAEKEHMERGIMVEGTRRRVEALISRRKHKKDYEYEVQWVGLRASKNTWFSKDELIELGYGKLATELDMKEAARMGLLGLTSKPLTSANIEKHLADFGIDPEFGTHSFMRGLSGGQKVKVVLAAAMWVNPHMLVLDEPTNYLDRDSLGALATAIKEYEGSVLMISHNSEFTEALCNETWHVAEGTVRVAGQAEEEEGEDLAGKTPEEMEAAIKARAAAKQAKLEKAAAKAEAKKAAQKIKFAKRH